MQPPPTRTRNARWFFAVLGLLALAAIIIPFIVGPMVHGLRPVTADHLKAARALWERDGPHSYDMEYRKSGSVTGTFEVQVRDGKAVSVLMDGQPLPPAQYPYYTMDGLLDDLERFLDIANKPGGPQVLLRARFDPQDGHLIRYIYKVPGTPQQIEVSVRLHRLDATGTAPN